MNDPASVTAPVVPLTVHAVSTTALNVDTGGGPSLYPVIGVWADLSPLREAGVEFNSGRPNSLPVLVITDSVLNSTNPALMTVVLARADDGNVAEADDPFAMHAFGPHWSAQVPTAWVSMATVVMGTSIQMRMILIDGAPPVDPSAHLLATDDDAFVILPTPGAVRDSLSKAMGSEWSVPLGDDRSADPDSDANVMRDMVWSNVAGIALGQDRAWNRTLNFAETAEGFADGNEADQQNLEATLEALSWALEASHSLPLPRDEDDEVAWPAPLRGLGQRFEDATDPVVVDGLDQGVPVGSAVSSWGTQAVLIAGAQVLAARALREPEPLRVADADGPREENSHRYEPQRSTSHTLALWFDEECDLPVWATRATHHLLVGHDSEVLVDFLVGDPDEALCGHGEYTLRTFHALAQALETLDLDVSGFAGRVERLAFTPPHLSDIVFACDAVLEAQARAAASGECVGCAGVEALLEVPMEANRAVGAVVAALPFVADLSADLHGLEVGDDEWVTYREEFLGHFLEHTAYSAERDLD
jgi:hypothetical protein